VQTAENLSLSRCKCHNRGKLCLIAWASLPSSVILPVSCNDASSLTQADNVSSFGHQGQKLVYGCGRAVVLRSIADPLQAELYTEHQKDVTVAKFSPSGAYVASADGEQHIIFFACSLSMHTVVLFCHVQLPKRKIVRFSALQNSFAKWIWFPEIRQHCTSCLTLQGL
jgi:hypothetical protein